MSEDAERKGLAEPFKGITANGVVTPGLFHIQSSGVSTEPVRNAAEMFLAALDAGQRAKTIFAVDDPEWRKWMNQHFYVRQGVSFKEMSEAQRGAAFGLMRASLSAKGMKLTRDIMRLNETLAELTNDSEFLGEYFVLGDQVVMTPFFAGAEPVIATAGKYKGTVVLQEEQNRRFAMLEALNAAQRKTAILNFSKTGNNNLTEAFKDNVVLDYAGGGGRGVIDAATAATRRSRRPLCRQHGRGPRTGENGRGKEAYRPHLLRLDWRDRRWRRLLLPHPQPGCY